MKLEAEEAATATAAAAAQGEEDGDARAAAPPPPPPPPPARYDRVLVDAECTHDGSLKHVAKLLQADDGGAALVARMLNKTRLRELPALQRRLLRSGFGLLRPGGLLVYSTCSFARAQNEDVVAWLLACEPDAGPSSFLLFALIFFCLLSLYSFVCSYSFVCFYSRV